MPRLPDVFLMIIASAAVSGTAVAQDVSRGEQIFKKCRACHAIGDGAVNKVGPLLTGVFGRKAGKIEDFNYSKAMKAAGAKGLVWDDTSLADYLEAPTKYLPKNKMAFVGIKDETERADLIAFLKSQN